MESYMGTSSVAEAERRIRKRVGRCSGFDDGKPTVTAFGLGQVSTQQDRILVIENFSGDRRCEVVRLVAQPEQQRTKVIRLVGPPRGWPVEEGA